MSYLKQSSRVHLKFCDISGSGKGTNFLEVLPNFQDGLEPLLPLPLRLHKFTFLYLHDFYCNLNTQDSHSVWLWGGWNILFCSRGEESLAKPIELFMPNPYSCTFVVIFTKTHRFHLCFTCILQKINETWNYSYNPSACCVQYDYEVEEINRFTFGETI